MKTYPKFFCYVFIILICAIFESCISQCGGDSVDDSITNTRFLGEIDNSFSDVDKQLIAYTVPNLSSPITEAQISTEEWSSYRASRFRPGFYRDDNDQKDRSAFDFYAPANKETGSRIEGKLPLIIFIHCGAFITGTKDNDLIISSLCRDFTRKGFATASINYRLLINTNNIVTKTITGLTAVFSKTSRNEVLYQNSICDIRRAVNYFRSHADELQIDADNIFLLGYSAGAMAALHSIYLDDAKAAPWIYGMNGYNKYVVGEPKPKVRGVIAVSGGFFKPPNEMWQDNENTPLLLVQGDEDEMVPYTEGRPFQRYIKDYRLNSPYLGEVSMDKSDNQGYVQHTTFTARVGVQIDAPVLDFLRGFFTDNIYGSSIIKANKPNNCTLVTVKGGKHYFVIDSINGGFNESYFTMREHALQFINHNKKENNDL
jgi:predicted esterase